MKLLFFRRQKHWTQGKDAQEKLARAAEKRRQTNAQKRLHWTQKEENRETVERVVQSMREGRKAKA